jgi:hypothetical protein
MKKYVLTESQIKKVVDTIIQEQIDQTKKKKLPASKTKSKKA